MALNEFMAWFQNALPNRQLIRHLSATIEKMLICALLIFVCLWAKMWWTGQCLARGFPQRRLAVSGTAAVLFLLLAPFALLGPALLFLNTALTGLALFDIWYFRFYGNVPSVAAWKDTRQLRPASRTFAFSGADWLVLAQPVMSGSLHLCAEAKQQDQC